MHSHKTWHDDISRKELILKGQTPNQRDKVKVSYRKQIARQGRPCKNFPHVQFDHRAEFDRFFLVLCARACPRS